MVVLLSHLRLRNLYYTQVCLFGLFFKNRNVHIVEYKTWVLLNPDFDMLDTYDRRQCNICHSCKGLAQLLFLFLLLHFQNDLGLMMFTLKYNHSLNVNITCGREDSYEYF